MSLFQHFIENMQLRNLSSFLLIWVFLTTNLMISPNLPAGDSLTTTLRILHSRTICNAAALLARIQHYVMLHALHLSCLISLSMFGPERAEHIAT